MKKTPQKPVKAPTTKAATERSNAENSYHLTLAEIKELIELVSEKQFNEFKLEYGSFRLQMQKGAVRTVVEPIPQPVSPQPLAVESKPFEFTPTDAHEPIAQPTLAEEPAVPKEKLHIITSPIVGTFYRAASPTAEPFVKLGDPVERGKTLCIIEAMKLMNEIEADANGEIAKIFVENGQPVEFGQPLFGLKA